VHLLTNHATSIIDHLERMVWCSKMI